MNVNSPNYENHFTVYAFIQSLCCTAKTKQYYAPIRFQQNWEE